MTGAFVYVYRMIVFMLVVGIIIAVVAIGIAVALVAVIGAVVMGLVMPSRTVRGQLRTLDLTISEGIAVVRALRPPI
jgi:hypothetical protein